MSSLATHSPTTRLVLVALGAGLTALAATGEAAAAVGTLHDFDPATDTVDVGAVGGVAVAGVDDFKADVSGVSTLDAAGVRTALGMAAADLDDQLDALPAENAAELLATDYTAATTAGTFGKWLNAVRTLLGHKSVEDAGGTSVSYKDTDDTTEAGTISWDEASKTRGRYTGF